MIKSSSSQEIKTIERNFKNEFCPVERRPYSFLQIKRNLYSLFSDQLPDTF